MIEGIIDFLSELEILIEIFVQVFQEINKVFVWILQAIATVLQVIAKVFQAITIVFVWILQAIAIVLQAIDKAFQAITIVLVWILQAIAKVFPELVILALTAIVSKARRHFFEYLEKKSKKKESLWNALVTALQKPAGLIVWIVGVSFVLEYVHFKTNAGILAAVPIIRSIAIIATLVWFVIRFRKNFDKND